MITKDNGKLRHLSPDLCSSDPYPPRPPTLASLRLLAEGRLHFSLFSPTPLFLYFCLGHRVTDKTKGGRARQE